MGHDATLLMPGDRSFQGRSADIYLDWPRDSFFPKLRGKAKDNLWASRTVRKLPALDVANFVLGFSLFPGGRNRYLDLPLLQGRGCAISYYGLGCDEVSLLRVRPEAAAGPCPSCEAFDPLGQACRAHNLGLRRRARSAAGQVDFVISSLYEFSHCHQFFPEATHDDIPFPVALDEIEFVGIPERRSPPLIIHAPTRRGFKGTAIVLRAIELLRDGGAEFDFELIEGVSHGEFLRGMARADIFIDQVFSESHAMAALESLAMGKVVLSGLGPHARDFFPFASDCPIIDAPSNAQSLCATLARALKRRDEFPKLAEQGRRYVAEHHDHVAIAARFADLWAQGRENSHPRRSGAARGIPSLMGQ